MGGLGYGRSLSRVIFPDQNRKCGHQKRYRHDADGGVFPPADGPSGAYTKDGADYDIAGARDGVGLIITGLLPVGIFPPGHGLSERYRSVYMPKACNLDDVRS